MGRKKTNEEFLKEVCDIVSNEYTFLEEYRGAKIHIRVLHNTCGYEYPVAPDNFINIGSRCSKCAGNAPYTIETFKQRVYELEHDNFTVVSNVYKNNQSKIKMRHNFCGHEWSITPANFIHHGERCPKCAGNLPYTLETLQKKIFDLVNDEYSLLSDIYKNTQTKIKIRHNICNYEYCVIPNAFLSGNRCPKCSGLLPYTIESLKLKVFEITNGEYTISSKEYKNNRTNIEIKHNICGHTYFATASNFIDGNRCPVCSSSKGEKVISNFLSSKGFYFLSEFKFDDCRNVRNLPFDFIVFGDKDIILLIEYDGIQHYEPTFGEKAFISTQINDNIKNEYCKLNNIKLIRIPYWNFKNINNILAQELL